MNRTLFLATLIAIAILLPFFALAQSPIDQVGASPVAVQTQTAQDLTPIPTIILGLKGGTVKVALSERLQTFDTGIRWLGTVELDSFEGVQLSNSAAVAGLEVLKPFSWNATPTLTLTPTIGVAWTPYVSGAKPNVGVVFGLGAKF